MTITINNKTLELVEVPEDAIDFELPYYDCKNHITYKYGSGTEDFDIFRKTIPSGSYALLFKASEATEEDLSDVVDGNNGGQNDTMWRDYKNNSFACFTCETKTESLHSLIRSLGMDENKVIILEKLK